ncbi:hypothetical protein ACFXEL_27885 [Streptomyces sp. NPDC059382]
MSQRRGSQNVGEGAFMVSREAVDAEPDRDVERLLRAGAARCEPAG